MPCVTSNSKCSSIITPSVLLISMFCTKMFDKITCILYISKTVCFLLVKRKKFFVFIG